MTLMMGSPVAKHRVNQTTRHRDLPHNVEYFQQSKERRSSVGNNKNIEPFRLSVTQNNWNNNERKSIETTFGGKTLQKDAT